MIFKWLSGQWVQIWEDKGHSDNELLFSTSCWTRNSHSDSWWSVCAAQCSLFAIIGILTDKMLACCIPSKQIQLSLWQSHCLAMFAIRREYIQSVCSPSPRTYLLLFLPSSHLS